MSNAHGVLIVNKPNGPTSHDVVATARREFGQRAVGHAGTLDPMASGVLVLLFGEATKLSNYLTAADKTYVATITFGRATDTLDALGTTTHTAEVPAGALTEERVCCGLARELARTEQIPPVFSAIHINGDRAHRVSRQGGDVALPARTVRLRQAELRGIGDDSVTVELSVSKGYYVRSFARDLGAHVGIPAHLSALTRTRSGAFSLDDAVAWPPEKTPPLMTVAEAVRSSLPTNILTEGGTERARQGKRLTREDFTKLSNHPGTGAWLTAQGQLIALGRPEGATFRVVRGFNLATSE